MDWIHADRQLPRRQKEKPKQSDNWHSHISRLSTSDGKSNKLIRLYHGSTRLVRASGCTLRLHQEGKARGEFMIARLKHKFTSSGLNSPVINYLHVLGITKGLVLVNKLLHVLSIRSSYARFARTDTVEPLRSCNLKARSLQSYLNVRRVSRRESRKVRAECTKSTSSV